MRATEWTSWGVTDSRSHIAVPTSRDDKYSRGVLGMVTGSETYPGSAVLGVEGAMRTGIGMVRYHGPERPTTMVLARRPEIVTVSGRVQAWVVGSGMTSDDLAEKNNEIYDCALAGDMPTVLDAGALEHVKKDNPFTVITPHHGELSRLLNRRDISVNVDEIAADPDVWAQRAADALSVTVLLKGSPTHIVTPGGDGIIVDDIPSWLATAGSGDVLAGILGALMATHHDEILTNPENLGALAATATVLHSCAARYASAGGPLVALDCAKAVSRAVAQCLE